MEKHLLSKSTFIRGVQCLKSLYLYKNRYFLRDKMSAGQLAIFARGIDVGILAQTLFPGGINCQPRSPHQYLKSVLKTQEIIETGRAEVIYEAAFQHDRVLILLDILAKVNGKWNAYEVKSSRSISETFLLDAALQYFVLKNSGIEIEKFFLVHLNGDYEFHEKLNIGELFAFADVTDKIAALQDFVSQKIDEEKRVIALQKSPEIAIGLHCNRPYPCDFIGHCWKNIPSKSVFDLSRFSDEEKFGFYGRGIISPDDISENMMADFDSRKRIEVRSVKENQPFLDKENLGLFFNKINELPGLIWFLGHRPAVPAHEKFRPYDVVPVCLGFQISQNNTSDTVFWFNENPDEVSDEKLISFIEKWSSPVNNLLIYQAGEFMEYLFRLTGRKPEMAGRVENILKKVSDLSVVFSEMDFVHPVLKGDFNLINVAAKLLGMDFPKNLLLKSDVLATNEFLKFSASGNLFEKSISMETILDYGRFQLDCAGGFYRFIKLKSDVVSKNF